MPALPSGRTCPYLVHSMAVCAPGGEGVKQKVPGPCPPSLGPHLSMILDSAPHPDPSASLWLAVPVLGAQPSPATLSQVARWALQSNVGSGEPAPWPCPWLWLLFNRQLPGRTGVVSGKSIRQCFQVEESF